MLGQWMEAEMREQPQALVANSNRYHSELASELGGREFQMVLLVARGSSDNAALYGRYLIEVHLQIPVSLAAPSVWTRFGSDVRFPKCLAVGISQSGAAPDVAEVLGALKRHGHATLAITNTEDSLITKVADHSLLLGVGEERSIAATKTYTASLLALHQLVRALGAGFPAPELPDDAWVQRSQLTAESHLGALLRSQTLFALGRGYAFSTAHETALKLMECALLPCKSYSSADFQHGPKALAGHGSCAVLFGEDGAALREQGALVVNAPEPERGIADPIWQVMYGQWLALLAARARGLDPDDAQFIQKVTQTI